ncbi:MAG: PaaI family thioesterase [Bacteroidales bacterium]|jgi:acyl-CoA thioesterase|nr:PaaI family thioesterase [Bacteroidales bacterium]
MKDDMIKNVRNDRFAKLAGIRLVEVSEGYAVTELTINENHLNGLDDVQGGVIFTLGDYAFAAASNSAGITTVAINVNITFFRPPAGKIIRAVAREINAQRKISGYRVDITDEDGSLIASFNGLGYRKTN